MAVVATVEFPDLVVKDGADRHAVVVAVCERLSEFGKPRSELRALGWRVACAYATVARAPEGRVRTWRVRLEKAEVGAEVEPTIVPVQWGLDDLGRWHLFEREGHAGKCPASKEGPSGKLVEELPNGVEGTACIECIRWLAWR